MFRTLIPVALAGLLLASPAAALPGPRDTPPGQEKRAKKGHDGELEGLNLTDEQREAIRALRQQIEQETVGNNKVALWQLRQQLQELTGIRGRGDAKGKRSQLDEATRTQAKALKERMAAMRQVMKDGHERFRAGVDAILTDEQKALREQRKAEREARREARPKGQKQRDKAHRRAPGQDRQRYAGVSADEAAQHGIFWNPQREKPGKRKGQDRAPRTP